MDDFIERMLERTNKRQELIASLSTEAPSKPILKSVESLPKVQEQSPPRRRRNRLAELASRVDQWLENDLETKPCENNLIDDLKVKSINPGNEVDKKLSTTMPPVNETVSETKMSKTNENEAPIQQQQFKKQPNINKVKQISQPHQSSDNGSTPLWQSPNLAASTLTVAQRRALFEQNIGIQQPIKKPKTTTIVTISMTKTTATTTTIDKISTSTCSIPNNIKTPPPKPSIKVQNEIPSKNLQQQPHPWTPPCIKNVLLKKQSIKQLDVEPRKIPDNEMTGKAVVTSSPINSNTVSSADRIAMSVGRVRFMPPSPSGGLYPDLSLIENDDTNNLVENQVIGCKRRNDGSNALNTSTTSSDSVHKDSEDDEMIVAKRSRCKLKIEDPGSPNMAACQEDITRESSLVMTSAVTPTNSCGNHSLSLLSGNSLSQICTSFTYYPNNDNDFQTFDANHIASTNILSENKQQQQSNNDNQTPSDIKLINHEEHKKPPSPPPSNCNRPALVHTVSTYRKQQQQLRLNGTSKTRNLEQNDDRSTALLKQRLQLLDDADDDEEDFMLQELEAAASRARRLERIVVPQQDSIIEQATQALNICDMYRQRSSSRSTVSSKFSSEHVHAERLLLIAGLRRTDAVREAQRLRVERTLLSGVTNEKYYKQLKIGGDGKKLIFESLRVPLLSSVISGGNKNKYNASEGMENLTRWPGGYRYFVCAIRAEATIRRPPVTVATRPADVVEESLLRFSGSTPAFQSENELSYGYVEFITKKPAKSSGGRKCLMPTEAEGGPIIINGLDDGGWKITVELYGLSSTATGELEHHGGICKEHDSPEKVKSVLDKLWSTVTTPNKESKKHHSSTATCIESPGGSMAVRNTVFRQLGYFVFSDGQVDRQQFTLNKVHQSSGARNTSNDTSQESVRLRMHLLDEGEHYAYEDDEDRINFENPSLKYGSHYTTVASIKPLTLPPECKRTEGFLTLFDDHELRTTHTFDRGPQWHRQSNIGSSISGGTTMWRRLWFSADIVDVPEQQETSNNGNEMQQKNLDIGQQQTIVLRYWMYPEHAEQQREPLGALDLSRCLPPLLPNVKSSTTVKGQLHQQMPVPAAPAPPDLCARPNTLRLLIHVNDNGDNDHGDNVDDPLLLSADTAEERREWCDTINAAVRAVGEHHERISIAKAAHLKQEEQDKEKLLQQRRQQEQQRTGVWPIAPSSNSKNYSKKKKLYK